jgi:RHS repeat-associated protein
MSSGSSRSAKCFRFQYTGQMWLAEAQLYHYKARAYHPGLGRFLQPDPIGFAGGMNLYAYVGNDPVNARDPWGTWGIYLGADFDAGGVVVGGFSIVAYHDCGNVLCSDAWGSEGWRGAVIIHGGIGFDYSVGLIAGFARNYDVLLGWGAYGELGVGVGSVNIAFPSDGSGIGTVQVELGLGPRFSGSGGVVLGLEAHRVRDGVSIDVSPIRLEVNGIHLDEVRITSRGIIGVGSRPGSRIRYRIPLTPPPPPPPQPATDPPRKRKK